MTRNGTAKYILFDTNAVYNDFTLKSERIESLKRYIAVTGSTILIPSILREEVLKQYQKDWLNAKHDLEKINVKFNNLVDIKHLEDEAMKIFRDGWDEFIAETSAIEIDTAELDLGEIIKRSLSEEKPFGEHSKGFRDTLLWMSAIEYLKRQRNARDFVFITNNSDDFGKKVLFDNLATESENTGRRVLYYSNVPRFLTEHANVSNVINDEWRDNIASDLIESSLHELIYRHQEDIFEEACRHVDDKVWDRLLVEEEYHNEDTLLDDYAIINYYVYAEDGDSYYVQLEVVSWLNVIIAMAFNADYDGFEYENYPVYINKTFWLNMQVSRDGKTSLAIHEEELL